MQGSHGYPVRLGSPPRLQPLPLSVDMGPFISWAADHGTSLIGVPLPMVAPAAALI